MDTYPQLERLDKPLLESCRAFREPERLKRRGFYPFFLPSYGCEGPVIRYDAHELLNFGSNNYQGLTNDPEVQAAAKAAIERYGTSHTGSPLLNGRSQLHEDLEKSLARFVGAEAALVFTTGYMANLGALSCLTRRDSVILTDREAHASLVAGARMAPCPMRRFRHNDVEALEKQLMKCSPGKALVAVDGVYSMSGDLAPLPELIEVCNRYQAPLLVDDAHSIGVYGKGRGTTAHFLLPTEMTRDILRTVTFSKALASIGGAIAGPNHVIEYIKHHASPLIFSAALPACNTAAALKALEIIEKRDRTDQLFTNAKRLRGGLQALGFETGSGQGPIIPIHIGDELATFAAWRSCFNAGLLVNAVVPPAVPKGQSLLRTSVMLSHNAEQIDRALEILGSTRNLLPGVPRAGSVTRQ